MKDTESKKWRSGLGMAHLDLRDLYICSNTVKLIVT